MRFKVDEYIVRLKGRNYSVLVFPFIKYMWAFDNRPKDCCYMVDGVVEAFVMLKYAMVILTEASDKIVYFPCKQEGIGDAVEKTINYILRLDSMQLVGGYGITVTNAEDIIEQFYIIKRAYNKMDEKQVFHVVFSVEKTLYFNTEQVKRLAYMLGQYFAMDRQVVFAVHNDTEHLHIHMIVNTVAYTNGQYQGFWNIEEIKAYAKKCVNLLIDEVWFAKKYKNA